MVLLRNSTRMNLYWQLSNSTLNLKNSNFSFNLTYQHFGIYIYNQANFCFIFQTLKFKLFLKLNEFPYTYNKLGNIVITIILTNISS